VKYQAKTIVSSLLFPVICFSLQAEADTLGTKEFGLTHKQLVQNVDKVEALISKCMRDQGFQYIAVDYNTIKKGMEADKKIPGLSEEEFTEKYGFGVSTFYTGLPPQLEEGYSPSKEGLGERNVEIYKNLSAADKVAYNRALLGEHTASTFAVSLEIESFARCGGCTLKAVKEVFKPDQINAKFYNPKDAAVNRDPRMKKALQKYAKAMRKSGFDYNHPDDVEPDIRDRLSAITNGGTIFLKSMSLDQKKALKNLQDYERRVAARNLELQEDLIDPVEETIEKEMFARKVQ